MKHPAATITITVLTVLAVAAILTWTPWIKKAAPFVGLTPK